MKLVTKQEKKHTETQTSMATHNGRYDIAYMFPGCTVFKYRLNSGDDKDCIRRRVSGAVSFVEIRHSIAA